MELFLMAIILAATGAQQSQLEGPENTLSVVGSNVTLKCSPSSRSCSRIGWWKHDNYQYADRLNDNTDWWTSYISYADRYSIDDSSGCDLFIRNVREMDAGRFRCQYDPSSHRSFEKEAHLTTLRTRPKCMITTYLNGLMEGDMVQLMCEVTYNGNSTPSMIWKGVEDAPGAVLNGKTISRAYSVVASATEVPSFTCVTSFAIETEDMLRSTKDHVAFNIPVTTCETPTINVLYSVRNVTLSPSLSVYSSESVITCTAEGRPSPTFKWQELENNGTWMDIQNLNGSEFTVTAASSRLYRCVAMNVVRGKIYQATSIQLQFSHTATAETKEYIGIGFVIGFVVAMLLACTVFAIFIKIRYLESRPKQNNEYHDGVPQHMNHELSTMNPSIPRTVPPLIVEQEAAYASLGECGDANEYETLEQGPI